MTRRGAGTVPTMSDDTDQSVPTGDDTPEAKPSVRVPNVRPGAVSGLDNVLLNPDAAAEAEAEYVQSDTAGTGEAVNADTGEVTAPGEPLPNADEPQPTNPDGSLIPTPDAEPANGDDVTPAADGEGNQPGPDTQG